jgi:hypothetical protein
VTTDNTRGTTNGAATQFVMFVHTGAVMLWQVATQRICRPMKAVACFRFAATLMTDEHRSLPLCSSMILCFFHLRFANVCDGTTSEGWSILQNLPLKMFGELSLCPHL